MAKASHREQILNVGLRLVHERGFAGASVRDIVQAASVPQGSFTNHFESKEAFGLAIIERYAETVSQLIDGTLRNDSLRPLQRLRAYIDTFKDSLNVSQMRNGCLLGNFAAEASGHSEAMRIRLIEIFMDLQNAVAYCLRAAVEARELAPETDCDEIAAFVVSSLQGAILISKAQRSTVPVERLKEILFSSVLKRFGVLSLPASGSSAARDIC